MSSALRLLSRLREFGNGSDPSFYLRTSLRQNNRAIEDAFRVIGAFMAPAYVETAGHTGSVTNTDFETIFESGSINSSGRRLSITMFPTGEGDSELSVSGGNLFLQLVRKNVSTSVEIVIGTHKISTAAIPLGSVTFSDIPGAGQFSYFLKARVSAGSGQISNAKLAVFELK